jgi:hypothetical protein
MKHFVPALLVILQAWMASLAMATTPRDVQQGVGIDPHVGNVLPLSAKLRDEGVGR